MFNPAASEEDRKVFVAVSGGVAHAAAHDKEGVVEELSFLEAKASGAGASQVR